jgi:hypothetical protein
VIALVTGIAASIRGNLAVLQHQFLDRLILFTGANDRNGS